MKFWNKLEPYMPILSTVFVVVCVAVSLHGYVAPVYAVEVPETIQTEDSDRNVKAKMETEEAAETEFETVKGSFDLADGSYEGSGTGFAGTITVSVDIKDRTISAIHILKTTDDAAFFNRAKSVIDQMIAEQTMDVDVVSGATYSSRGIINAVKNALTGEMDENVPVSSGTSGGGVGTTSVSKVEDADGYIDGIYYGSGVGFAGTIGVRVVVQDGAISVIEITDTSDDSSYINRASAVTERIISTQSTNVDTVSGATYSSVGIINAVRDALSEAAVSGSVASGDEIKDEEMVITGTIPYKNGIYAGIGEGYLGDIETCIVIQDKTIKAIFVTETQDDAAYINRAKSVIDAALRMQNTDVDTVSGATFSSKGILEAIENALKAADEATNGKTEEPENPEMTDKPNVPDESEDGQTIYMDGDYAAAVLCEPDEDRDFEAYTLSLKIKVKNDKITAVTDISGDGDASNDTYIQRAANGTSKIPGVVTQIVEKGLPEGIDTVSRATCSSKSIVEACMKALESARR
ncbi:MAG: FMN-binding protein [Coprococcus sp.]